MKFLTVLTVIFCLAAAVRAYGYGGGSNGGGSCGGGSAAIPAPPCPKNYMLACTPNVAEVPCSSSSCSGGHGGSGAYSNNFNYDAVPQYNYGSYRPTNDQQ